MMETWITRWEVACGVAPRLSRFFASPAARTLLREFQSCAKATGDVEVLAFLLIFSVWPEHASTNRPSPQMLKATARSLDQCRRRVAKLVNTGLLGVPEAAKQTCDRLEQWSTHLTAEARGWPMVTMGRFAVGARPTTGKRHRAKRQVVEFLTHYFATLACPAPPWRIITRFLMLANLAPSTATDKHLATWWSNVLRREHRTGDVEALARYQADQLRLFEHLKHDVWSDSP